LSWKSVFRSCLREKRIQDSHDKLKEVFERKIFKNFYFLFNEKEVLSTLEKSQNLFLTPSDLSQKSLKKKISSRDAEPFRGKVDFGPVGPTQNWTGPNFKNLFKFVC